MKLLAVGGGSGGHVTPVLAVINELSQLDKSLGVDFICDKKFEVQARGLMEHAKVQVRVSTIYAGKLRRYHGVSVGRQLLDVSTNLHNIKDIFLVGVGFLQSIFRLISNRPDVVFAKGGYVCLPVGAAARILKIPLVIHDSDSRPGLTNKILSRWAVKIGTGAPIENYNYPKDITSYVGVPVDPRFHSFSTNEQTTAKAEIGVVDLNKPLVVVVGGGLGARSINNAIVQEASALIDAGCSIYHVTGKAHYDELKKRALNHAAYQMVPFVYKDMHKVLGAADVVITRGSATFLQELAALAKPVVIIPAAQLGDQQKNATHYAEAGAGIVLQDNELKTINILSQTILEILKNPHQTAVMVKNLQQFARPDAALDMAQLIVSAAQK